MLMLRDIRQRQPQAQHHSDESECYGLQCLHTPRLRNGSHSKRQAKYNTGQHIILGLFFVMS